MIINTQIKWHKIKWRQIVTKVINTSFRIKEGHKYTAKNRKFTGILQLISPVNLQEKLFFQLNTNILDCIIYGQNQFINVCLFRGKSRFLCFFLLGITAELFLVLHLFYFIYFLFSVMAIKDKYCMPFICINI